MLDAIRWDTDLIRRYDLAGPRYTSYPTAVQFHDGRRARSTCCTPCATVPQAKRALVALCAPAVLRPPLLLLRLATRSSPRTVAAARPTWSAWKRKSLWSARHLDPATGGRTAALRRRHSDLPQPRRTAPADGRSAPALPPARRRLRATTASRSTRAKPTGRPWACCASSVSTASASACRPSIRTCNWPSTACRASSRPEPSSRPRGPCNTARSTSICSMACRKQTPERLRPHRRRDHRPAARPPVDLQLRAPARSCSSPSGASTPRICPVPNSSWKCCTTP